MNVRPIFRLFLLASIVFTAMHARTQFYFAGQDPASVQWLQINTENFQVIFPRGYEEHGQYISNVLEWSYEHATTSLEHRPRKVSVIVHNQTVISNGFVSWAPRRVELYTTPPSDNDHHDWMERLVIHEFRHVVQIDKLNQGLTRLLTLLFGEMATGAVVGHIPLWFLEGDAVVTETAMTSAGRGRLPRFEQGLRAQVLSRRIYSMDKAVFGSYKDYVPNHYELGYQLVAAVRARYGKNAWAPVLDNVARRPWGLFPFAAEMKRQFGYGKIKLYNHTFGQLEKDWSLQQQSHVYSPAQTVNQPQKHYASYLYPHWINDSTLIVLKTGLKDIPHLISIDLRGNEKKLFAPGTVFPNSLHYAAGKIVWSEFNPDPRWEHRNYAEIVVYNLHTRERHRITQKGKYFAPALSPDGEQVAAVETAPQGTYALVVLNAVTGDEVWRFSYENNDFIMQPAWHPGGEKIALIALNSEGKRLDEISLKDKTPKTLLRAHDGDISSPAYLGEDIIFNATWSGIDNIYLFRRRTGLSEMVVSSEFGAVNASANTIYKLAFSDYTAEGYQLKTLEAANFMNLPFQQVEDHSVGLHKIIAKQENAVVSPENVPKNEYDIKEYSRLRNLFYLHSWVPAHLDVDNLEANPGASLLFQNKLSTSFAQLGYKWDINDETGRYTASYSYHGWYPVIELTAETGDRRFYYNADEESYDFLWQENTYQLSFSIPLRFQKKAYFYGLTPQLDLGINHAAQSRNTPDSIFVGNDTFYQFRETRFYTQQYRLLAYRQRRSVARDIFPRYGQILDLHYRHSPFKGGDMGSIAAFRGVLFFPGLVRHHGIRLSAAYQYREPGENIREPETISLFYSFGNIIGYPRGMQGKSHQELKTFSVDYALPLLYPDLSIPYLLYLKRLRSYVFYDYAGATPFPDPETGNQFTEEFLFSYGVGLIGDLHLFGLAPSLSLGAQIAFPDGNAPAYQFIFNFSF